MCSVLNMWLYFIYDQTTPTPDIIKTSFRNFRHNLDTIKISLKNPDIVQKPFKIEWLIQFVLSNLSLKTVSASSCSWLSPFLNLSVSSSLTFTLSLVPFSRMFFFHGTQVFQFSKFLHLRGNFCFHIQNALFQTLILFFSPGGACTARGSTSGVGECVSQWVSAWQIFYV